MRELLTGAVSEIAVVGAHCDDIAIGIGGTLL
jgi:LmbE family N-acetylglucosaminyl deacetylase